MTGAGPVTNGEEDALPNEKDVVGAEDAAVGAPAKGDALSVLLEFAALPKVNPVVGGGAVDPNEKEPPPADDNGIDGLKVNGDKVAAVAAVAFVDERLKKVDGVWPNECGVAGALGFRLANGFGFLQIVLSG